MSVHDCMLLCGKMAATKASEFKHVDDFSLKSSKLVAECMLE